METTDGRNLVENLIIKYKNDLEDQNKEYNIPIIIFTEESSRETLNVTINSTQETVNETEEQEIIEETQNKTVENKTVEKDELNESLIEQKFKFIEISFQSFFFIAPRLKRS